LWPLGFIDQAESGGDHGVEESDAPLESGEFVVNRDLRSLRKWEGISGGQHVQIPSSSGDDSEGLMGEKWQPGPVSRWQSIGGVHVCPMRRTYVVSHRGPHLLGTDIARHAAGR